MARRNINTRFGYRSSVNLKSLEAELQAQSAQRPQPELLHETQPEPQPTPEQRPDRRRQVRRVGYGGIPGAALSTLVIGRLVETDSLRALQEELIGAAPQFGYTASGRIENPGVIYSSGPQIANTAQMNPGNVVHTNPYRLLAAVRAGYDGSDTESGENLELSEKVTLIGALALAPALKSKNGNRHTRLQLEVRQPDEAERLRTERAAVMNTLDPSFLIRHADGHMAKALAIPLVNLAEPEAGDGLHELLAESYSIPEQLTLQPLEVYSNTTQRLINNL